ncbi:MAG: hypothetical protein VKK43_04995 [Synechococcaceae cyanobacterium]|nr:hypothetical protein [Synechococcaceae cyanobacterium]
MILASFDRPRQGRTCLEEPARQTYPRDRFKVIVVDDASPHPTGLQDLERRQEAAPTPLIDAQPAPCGHGVCPLHRLSRIGARHCRCNLVPILILWQIANLCGFHFQWMRQDDEVCRLSR